MGKKTKDIRLHLDLEIQMNIASDLAHRNPRLKKYPNKCLNRFYIRAYNYPSLERGNDFDEALQKEFDEIFDKTYGEIFPTFPWPVIRVEKYEQSPSELVLRVDLNYTKKELMFRTEQFINLAIEEYKKTSVKKIERKHPEKWATYLEIWDLKNGYPPWIKCDDGFKIPPKMKRGKPWTYEQIAKYLFPDAQSPNELARAVDTTKKQYRAAYKLICGEDYNPKNRKNIINKLKESEDKKISCDNCIERQDCKELCPLILEEVAKLEVKQAHLIVSSVEKTGLERNIKSKKLPSSDKQFK